MRTCNTCFLAEGKVNFSGCRRKCNTCRGREYYAKNRDVIRAKAKVYAQNNQEKVRAYKEGYYRRNPTYRFRSGLWQNYKMTPEEYFALRDQQQGKCGICLQVPEKILHVDHDHATGRIRGLLCSSCNNGLGRFRDNTEYLLSAIRYLESA